MNISELIKNLQELKSVHGDIPCCIGEAHEYWGRTEFEISEYNLVVSQHAQPKGPKSGLSEKALVFTPLDL